MKKLILVGITSALSFWVGGLATLLTEFHAEYGCIITAPDFLLAYAIWPYRLLQYWL